MHKCNLADMYYIYAIMRLGKLLATHFSILTALVWQQKWHRECSNCSAEWHDG